VSKTVSKMVDKAVLIAGKIAGKIGTRMLQTDLLACMRKKEKLDPTSFKLSYPFASLGVRYDLGYHQTIPYISASIS
jgi:hypothetical protein